MKLRLPGFTTPVCKEFPRRHITNVQLLSRWIKHNVLDLAFLEFKPEDAGIDAITQDGDSVGMRSGFQ